MPNQNGLAENHKDLQNEMRKFLTGYGVVTTPLAYAGTGDGIVYKPASHPNNPTEVWTWVCTTAGGFGVGKFSVTGSVTGATAEATVGVFYDNNIVEFVIQAGAADFAINDQFDMTVTVSTWNFGTDEWETLRYRPQPTELEAGNFVSPEHAVTDDDTYCYRTGNTTGIFHMKYPTGIAFVDYGVKSRGDATFNAAEAPYDWTLEWSDDGVNWTVEDTQTAQVFTRAAEIKTYPLTTDRHIWWRLNITNNNGGADLEFSNILMSQSGVIGDTPSGKDLIMKGQGLSGTDEIYFGCQSHEDTSAPYYQLLLYGFTAYDEDAALPYQPGINPDNPNYVGDINTCEYWFTGNGRYFHMTTKISTVYTSLYAGLLLPYGEPSSYAYPLYIAATTGASRHYTSTDHLMRHCFDPSDGGGWLRLPGGSWGAVMSAYNTYWSYNRNVWPYSSGSSTMLEGNLSLTEGYDGSYALTPLVIMEYESQNASVYSPNAYGEIQGGFHISGSNNSAEATLTVDGDEYIVFQSAFRTTKRDFYAVRLEP